MKFWIDRSHEARDRLSREVSAVRLRVGLSSPSLFLTSVWVFLSHLIASTVPVELPGGELYVDSPTRLPGDEQPLLIK